MDAQEGAAETRASVPLILGKFGDVVRIAVTQVRFCRCCFGAVSGGWLLVNGGWLVRRLIGSEFRI